jgi:methyl-accepting chemotaxis protein
VIEDWTTKAPAPPPPTAASRRHFGVAMLAIGGFGIVAGILTMVIGIRMTNEIEHSVDASLVTTGDALTVVSDSITLSSQIVDTVRDGLKGVTATMNVLEDSIATGTNVINDSNTFLGTSLPDTLDAINGVLPTIQNVASTIDSTLQLIANVPFAPDYNPTVPLGDAVGQLVDAMAPLPGQLRQLVSGFGDLSTSATNVSNQLTTLSDSLDQLDDDLGQVQQLIGRYSTTTEQATTRVTASRHDLNSSADAMRALFVVLGLVIALGQIVPIWLGVSLIRSSPVQTVP